MLVLSRKEGEKIQIGDNATFTISQIHGNRVSIAIEAPRDVRIVRGELPARVETESEEINRLLIEGRDCNNRINAIVDRISYLSQDFDSEFIMDAINGRIKLRPLVSLNPKNITE